MPPPSRKSMMSTASGQSRASAMSGYSKVSVKPGKKSVMSMGGRSVKGRGNGDRSNSVYAPSDRASVCSANSRVSGVSQMSRRSGYSIASRSTLASGRSFQSQCSRYSIMAPRVAAKPSCCTDFPFVLLSLGMLGADACALYFPWFVADQKTEFTIRRLFDGTGVEPCLQLDIAGILFLVSAICSFFSLFFSSFTFCCMNFRFQASRIRRSNGMFVGSSMICRFAALGACATLARFLELDIGLFCGIGGAGLAILAFILSWFLMPPSKTV